MLYNIVSELIYFIPNSLYLLSPYPFILPLPLPSPHWEPLVCSLYLCFVTFIHLFSQLHFYVFLICIFLSVCPSLVPNHIS